MIEPITVYAVSSGEYNDYSVLAIFRRKEDAEEFVKMTPKPLASPSRFIEEFDFYEGEPTPIEEDRP